MPGAPLKGEGGGSQASIRGIWLNGFGERPLGGASQGCKLGGLYGTRVASGRSTPAWEQLLFMIRADGDMRMRFLFEVTMREFLEKHLDSLTWKSIAVAAEGCGRHLGAKGPLRRGDRGSNEVSWKSRRPRPYAALAAPADGTEDAADAWLGVFRKQPQ